MGYWTNYSLASVSPRGLTITWWGCYGLCFWHKPTELANSFSFCCFVCFCLYGPFSCISFHKFSRQLSAFSLCSCGLISAVLDFSTLYLFMKVSLSPDVILCGWLGLKHQLTNLLFPQLFSLTALCSRSCIVSQLYGPTALCCQSSIASQLYFPSDCETRVSCNLKL